jgi:hypothetical protein
MSFDVFILCLLALATVCYGIEKFSMTKDKND